MPKTPNHPKPRRPTLKSKRAKQTPPVGQASSPPSSSPSVPPVGQASSLPSCFPPPPSPSSQDHLIERLLHLWEHDHLPLSAIAAELGLSLRALLDLIRTPEVDELLTQMDHLLERRTRQTALAKSRRALITLEKVQTEAEADASLTPITPQAIKAHRDARTARNQRRLAAAATLNQLRILKPPTRKLTPTPNHSTDQPRARAA